MGKSQNRRDSSRYSPRYDWSRSLILPVLFFTFSIAVHALGPQARSYSLSVKNSSDYTINELYISRSGREYWGANQLANGPLRRGQTFRLPDIPAGQYDVKLVDNNGDVCIQQAMRIFDDVLLELTNDWLSRCQGQKTPD
jgi:hypothetical protein